MLIKGGSFGEKSVKKVKFFGAFLVFFCFFLSLGKKWKKNGIYDWLSFKKILRR
jgi:hypothetical protein